MRYFAVLMIAIAVTLGGLAAYQKFLLPKQIKKVYVVNTDTLINFEKNNILQAAKNKDRQKFQEALNMDKKFQEAINYIAKRDNAVVFAKKAVMSGYDKDITNEVLILTGVK